MIRYCFLTSVVVLVAGDSGLGLGRLHYGDLKADLSLILDLLELPLLLSALRLHTVQLAEHLRLLFDVDHVGELIPHVPLAGLLVSANTAQ